METAELNMIGKLELNQIYCIDCVLGMQKIWNCNFSSDNTHKPYMFLYALYGSKNLSLKNLHYQIF